MQNQFSKPPSYCCQKCGECIGWIGRFLFPFLHKCQMKGKDRANSFACWIFGHKWKDWVATGSKLEWKEVCDNGFGISSLKLIPVSYGHSVNLDFCKRCGEPNPEVLYDNSKQ